jgi:apolipoprotein N-acyltransferase
MVQPNIPVEGDWNNEQFFEQMTLRHLQLAEQGIAEAEKKEREDNEDAATQATDGTTTNSGNLAKTRLVIFPEAPINFHYEDDAKLRKLLADFTKRHNVYLLMSSWGIAKEGDAPESNYNSAYLIRPDGELLTRYDKMALMPFGEYVPARGWLPFMDRIPTLVADVKAGKQFILSDVDNVKLATMICFEVTRPDIARRFRRDGATFFVQLSNETWFGQAAVARQTLAQAVFRAVENDVDLLRVTNSGLSAGITQQGEVLDETPMFQTATRSFQVNVTSAEPLTIYTRFGDWFAVTCAVVSAALLIASGIFEILRKREEKND